MFFQAKGSSHASMQDLREYMSSYLKLDDEHITAFLDVLRGLPCARRAAKEGVDLDEILKATWETFDKDNSGSLEESEFRLFMEAAPIQFSAEDIENMFARADVDGNGNISFTEFIPVFHAVMLTGITSA
mmetsp:Transcript_11587/g.26981  ORF Transcript_11587/g.26981 Transcript_11587/m.26981 type:complete len:130 (-) Transcript_11587:24-413(-)